MGKLALEPRDAVFAGIAFIALMLVFAALASLAGWPNARSGWQFAVTLAIVIALLPVIIRTLTFLQESRASIEAPFGLKLSFANAIVRADVTTLPENMAQPGAVSASSRKGRTPAGKHGRQAQSSGLRGRLARRVPGPARSIAAGAQTGRS